MGVNGPYHDNRAHKRRHVMEDSKEQYSSPSKPLPNLAPGEAKSFPKLEKILPNLESSKAKFSSSTTHHQHDNQLSMKEEDSDEDGLSCISNEEDANDHAAINSNYEGISKNHEEINEDCGEISEDHEEQRAFNVTEGINYGFRRFCICPRVSSSTWPSHNRSPSSSQNPQSFLHSSGRLTLEQESMCGTRKLTIDLEFEDYFATLLVD